LKVSFLHAIYWQNLKNFLFEVVQCSVADKGPKSEGKEVKGRGELGTGGNRLSISGIFCIVVGGYMGLLFQLTWGLGA